MNIIKYKAFNKVDEDNCLVNNYGNTFKIGVTYKIDKDIKYGCDGYGFHFASMFVDTFRFVNSDTPILCEVLVSGNIINHDDEYNGYYDMGVSKTMKIIRIIPRLEVIEMAYNLNSHDKNKFLVTYPLTDNEFEYFKTGLKNISEFTYAKYRVKVKTK